MAAVLEVVNSSFEELRVAQREVAALHAANYSADRGFDMPLDAARLAALMHSLLPRSPGWHEGPDSPGTTQHMAARMVDALAFAGVRNGDDLRARITANQVGDDTAEYATAASLASDDVSHVTRLLLMLGREDPSLLGDCFPWEAGDAYLAAVLGL